MPTLAEIWDFLLRFKAATEAGFGRVQAQIDDLRVQVVGIQGEFGGIKGEIVAIKGEIGGMKAQLNRIEARLVRIESWNVDRRLDDHEQRILRLERQAQTG